MFLLSRCYSGRAGGTGGGGERRGSILECRITCSYDQVWKEDTVGNKLSRMHEGGRGVWKVNKMKVEEGEMRFSR